MEREYWVSCIEFTSWVKINEKNIIIDTSPFLRKFLNQNSKNLGNWIRYHKWEPLYIKRLK